MANVLIIAEAGVNHNGSIETAKKLVDIACEAKADIVKFQLFKAKDLTTKKAPKANYQLKSTPLSESQYEMLEKLELTLEEFVDLKKYCERKGIEFLATPFDIKSIEFLEELGINRWKVPSGEITNLPYLERIASSNKPILLSTGMSNLDEVKIAVNLLKAKGNTNITLLHCTTEYPTSHDDVNLNAMITMQNATGLSIGYSDHTLGIEVPVAAVALGASVIEKHFTIDKTLHGPDHISSLDPAELISMVKSIRNIEVALGDGVKKAVNSEKKNLEIVRKSIVASKFIRAGDIFSEDNLTVKRPGSGISPMKWHEIIGIKAKRDFNVDDLIEI